MSITDAPAATIAESPVIRFNAAHTDLVEATLPELVTQTGITWKEVENGKEVYIPTKTIISYLKEKQDSEPHTVCQLIKIVREETNQVTNPRTWLKDCIDCLDKLENPNADSYDIEEAKYRLPISKDTLSFCLTDIPNQLLAIHSLITDPEFRIIIEKYTNLYGNNPYKGDSNIPTGNTCSEYLAANLKAIGELIKRRQQQFDETLQQTESLERVRNAPSISQS